MWGAVLLFLFIFNYLSMTSRARDLEAKIAALTNTLRERQQRIAQLNAALADNRPFTRSQANHEKTIDEVYEQRNLLAQLVAVRAPMLARIRDPDGDWPVLMFYLNGKEVSFHIPQGELCDGLKKLGPAPDWDGSTWKEHRTRIHDAMHDAMN